MADKLGESLVANNSQLQYGWPTNPEITASDVSPPYDDAMGLLLGLWPWAMAGGPAQAQSFTVEPMPSISSSLPNEGDPGGMRRWLRDHGVTYGWILTSEVLGNLSGGLRRGAIFDGKFEGLLGIDFEKLAGWQGLTLFSNFFQIHGTGGARADLAGGLITVSNIEALPSTRLSELWLEQKFLDGQLGFRFGQLTSDSEFFNSQYFTHFINSDWPTITGSNLPSGGPAYPLATPGVRLRFDPNPETSFLLALFNGDPAGPGLDDPQRRNSTGLNFRVNDPPLVMGEFQYRYNQDKSATGLAGGIRLGAWHHFGRFNDQRFDLSLADPLSSGIARRFRGNDGIYGVFDQQLYRPAGGDAASGVTIFSRVSASPPQQNLIDFYLDGGVIFTGMLPQRPLDAFGGTFIYVHISDRARGFDRDSAFFSGMQQPLRDYELAFEFNYSATLVPGWTLQPTVKYVIHPGGHVPDPNAASLATPIRNAVIVGVRSTIRY